MTALVRIQLGLRGLPARVPYGVPVLNVQIFTVDVGRYVIITITGQTQQLCIFIESISAAGVGYQTEKLIAAQVVDPGQGSGGGGNDLLPPGIIEMTEFHMCTLLTCHGCGNDND